MIDVRYYDGRARIAQAPTHLALVVAEERMKLDFSSVRSKSFGYVRFSLRKCVRVWIFTE